MNEMEGREAGSIKWCSEINTTYPGEDRPQTMWPACASVLQKVCSE